MIEVLLIPALWTDLQISLIITLKRETFEPSLIFPSVNLSAVATLTLPIVPSLALFWSQCCTFHRISLISALHLGSCSRSALHLGCRKILAAWWPMPIWAIRVYEGWSTESTWGPAERGTAVSENPPWLNIQVTVHISTKYHVHIIWVPAPCWASSKRSLVHLCLWLAFYLIFTKCESSMWD